VFQTVEEVSFAANGITAAGIKAFDGVLQSNIVLRSAQSPLLMTIYFDI